MSDAGNIEKDEAPFRDKLQYETILGFRKTVPPVLKQEREPLLYDPEKQEEN
jgi:hypothetical protein